MSVALYRKYRPGSFGEVRGQEHVTEPLRQALRTGRINHAYLFSGPRGCGKTTSARILARSLNCAEGPTPDPCGTCDSCVALAPDGAGSVDVIEIDAASHGGVDDARELRERAFFAPVSSRYKVYIVDEAHMVTREGFNALLKLVEEPPPHLKFIFATTEPDKVISTIRSRTHHYPFRLIAPSTLRQLMEEILASEGIAYDAAALPLVVRAGAGSARDSLSVLDQLLAGSDERGITRDGAVGLLGYTDSTLLAEMVQALGAQDGAAVFELIDRIVEAGNDPRRFAADLLERIRDLLVLTAVPDALDKGLINVSPDATEQMERQARSIGHSALTHAASTLSEGLTQMRGATAPRLQLELICARILYPATVGVAQPATAAPPVAASGPSTTQAPTAAQPPQATPRPAPTQQPQPQRSTAQPPPARPAQARPPETQQDPPQQAPEPQGNAPNPGPASTPPDDVGTAAAGSDAPPERPETASPAVSAASPSAPAAPSPGGPGGSSASGDPTTQSVLNAWPRVMEAVKTRRRFTWMILAGEGVGVVAVDGKTLRIGFPRANDAKGFSRSGSDQILQAALNDVLGVELHVVAVEGEASPAPTGQQDAGPPPAASPMGADNAPSTPVTDPGHPPAARTNGPAPTPPPPVDDDQPPPPSEPMPSGDDGGDEPSAGPPSGGNAASSFTGRPVTTSGNGGGRSGNGGPPSGAARAPQRPSAADTASATTEPVSLIQNELGGRLVEEIDHRQESSS
ncbi:DNA polymerase III subunit gamma and tau [Spiractinospora alimapuensis]|uniref:DNA polymerase III subunit gamma and tau n=1 Tax=Spiractinospora alimapuensis TaxID=2820884 RepID=UPI001F210876|nr:DNA polymerase III subunit gamma and tau [Spiractinospora alimapuensis]QVQ50527.1 DNA polymerase III subunit gamma and tau [Spiractinospora alimapuensis]